MRDLMKLFQKHYSAVNSSDGGPNNNNCTVEENLEHLQKIGFNARHRKSLQSTRPLRGLSIVDSFFSKPIAGKRYPKCKHFVFDWLILWILCFLNEQFSIRLCSIVLCASFDIQYRIDLFERNKKIKKSWKSTSWSHLSVSLACRNDFRAYAIINVQLVFVEDHALFSG